MCEDVIHDKGDIGVVNVVEKLREIFRPRLSLFEIIRDHGGAKGPTECLWSYKNKYDVPLRTITEMLLMQGLKKKEESASGSRPLTAKQEQYLQARDRSKSRSHSKSPITAKSRNPERGRTSVKAETKEETVKDDGYGAAASDIVAAVASDIIGSVKDLAEDVIAAANDVAPEREPTAEEPPEDRD